MSDRTARGRVRLGWLIASLAMNVLLATALLTTWGMRAYSRPVASGSPLAFASEAMRILPEPSAQILRDHWSERAPTIREAEQASQRWRREIGDRMTQAEFDEVALREAIDAARVHRKQAIDEIVEVLVETVRDLKPEDRRRLGEAIQGGSE